MKGGDLIMIVTQQIQVDLTDKQQRPSIDAVQGDTAKAVKITLTAGGVAWTIPSGAAALIRYRKLDGTGGSYDTMPDGSAAYTIDGSTITIRLAPETMTDSGVTQLQVVLRQNGAELAAFTMNLSVEPDPSIDTMDSKDFVNHSVQIRNLFDELYGQTFDDGGYIVQKLDDLHHRVSTAFACGTLNTGDGTEVAQSDRIRSDFFFHGGRRITVTIPEGVKVRLFFYNREQGYLTESPYHDTSFTISNPGIYARCVAAYADDSPITDPDALADKVGIFYRGECHDGFRGHIKALGLTAFAQCTEQGYYRFTAADIDEISDAPALTTGGILQVWPNAAAGGIFQTITTGNGEIWFRSGTANFVKVVSGMNADRTLCYRGNVVALGFETLAACTMPGYYAFTTADLEKLTDAPAASGGGILEVRPHAGSGFVFQTLHTGGGEIWFRWGSNPFVKTASGLDADRQLCYRGNVVAQGYSNFSQCQLPGYYAFTAADLDSLSDKPAIENSGVLIVEPYAAGWVFQTIKTILGEVWFRYGTTPFQKLTGGSSGVAVNWLALGDSITEGYNSSLADGEAVTGFNKQLCWATLTAKFNGWNLHNYAIGGTGYVSKNPSTGNNKQNIREVVAELCAAHKFQEMELVTLFGGCNDWKYNLPLGSMADDIASGGTLYSNMRWCINAIMQDNPHIKIVVISPVNCCRYGDADTNWGMGYAFPNNGTLEDIFRAEQEVCAYYGIEFIDMLHSSVINRLNIEAVLPDGAHPTVECHRAMAYELSRKIMAGAPARKAMMEKIETLTADGTQKQLSLTTAGLQAFRLCVETPAGTASSTVYVDVHTLEGEQAASCYIGSGINTAGARCFNIMGDTNHGLSDVRFTLAAASGLTGVNIQTQPKTVQTRGYSKIVLTASSTEFPAGTTITLWGIRL